ncbi:hypothetical protein Lser_V15G31854 [Lactuca serriola]
MSQSNITTSNLNVPVSEVYWSLVAKADKKFSKIRDLPYYERNRYDTYFYKVFKVYTQLWKFQQDNRQKLVEAGLKRWEIGDIASRIGQLYFGQYMRTSVASYLSESYIFYEAILTREYFKDGLLQDVNLANKQLRFIARFLTVCLMLNKREMVYRLVSQLKVLVADCKRTFQDTDFIEWKLVIQEITKFLKVDTALMNTRPLRYSLTLDVEPNSLPPVPNVIRNLKLRDAILCSYHPNEVKFSELTLDNFRMLQCLEWEPSGSFYQSSGSLTSGQHAVNQEISDPTLPPNPRKAVLYRPSITHFLAVLATVCEELPPDGVLLLYISAPDAACTSPPSDNTNSSSVKKIMNGSGDHSRGVNLGSKGNGGLNVIYPCDLIPFTRRPLFLVIDSEKSNAFKSLEREVNGEAVAMLLSPASSIGDPNGSRQFTTFLTAPLQAFLILIGFSGPDIQTDKLNEAERVLSLALNHWGDTLALNLAVSPDSLHPVWAQILNDPFLRRLLLRFIFCRAVLSLYTPTSNKKEYLPDCSPALPNSVSPTHGTYKEAVHKIADIFGVAPMFNLPEPLQPKPPDV